MGDTFPFFYGTKPAAKTEKCHPFPASRALSIKSEVETLNKTKFTPEQQAAIEHRGTSLLVSAAAGSGKTRVLVERLLERIEEGSNIDEFLIITYTRAAAHELKERISDGLYERQRQNQRKAHYRRQQMLCSTASIDTIHTFCGEVLRENAHLVGLPPDFRVIDENECEIIKREVLSDVLDLAYENLTEEQDGLADLLSLVIEGRDDKNLEEIVLDINRKLQSLPNPDMWITEQTEKLEQIGLYELSETDSGKYILDELKNLVSYCANQMNALRGEATVNTEYREKCSDSIEVSYLGIKKLEESLNIGWDKAANDKNIEFPRTGNLKGYDELKGIRAWCRDELRKNTKILEISSGEHMKDLVQISPALSALLNLVKNFDEFFRTEKRKRGVADFSDLEHLTLSLLIDKESGEKTQIAKSLSKRFTEIMVDEYQDVNEVQEMIFRAISQNESNVFMVGDVKQSIYRFRLADPGIFLSKYDAFSELSEKTSTNGTKIHLSKNFRSHSGILETVNYIFTRIMSPKLGEMYYSEHEKLVPGRVEHQKQGIQGIQGMCEAQEFDEVQSAVGGSVLDVPLPKSQQPSPIFSSYQMYNTHPVEFDFISTKVKEGEMTEEDGQEDVKAIDLEAKHIANRIVELFETGYEVPEKDGTSRPLRYSDIAVLSRSQKGVANRYALALGSAGIPTDFTSGEDFFESREISTVLSLLSVIDNPTLDIDLVATMCGPIYKFSSDELGIIKTHKSHDSYYNLVISAAEHNIGSDEIACKCRKLIDDLETFSTIATDMPSDRLLWNIYNKTELMGIISSMSSSEQRKENLVMLTELAANLEQSGYKGVFGFLSFIRKLKSGNLAQSGTTAGTASNQDAVTIMTIHKSKGLEFPVVFLANTSKRHNNLDSQKQLVFHKELGVGSMLINREKRIKYSTIQRTAIASKLRAEMLSEELRVLYVAMTRACEKLIVTATYSDAQAKAEKLEQTIIDMPSPQFLSRLSSISDWLIAGIKGIDENLAKVNFIDAETIMENETKISACASTNIKQTADTLNKPSLDFDYPFKNSIDIPSKLTVTGLKSLADKEAKSAPWVMAKMRETTSFTRPSFVEKHEKRTATEMGVLLHHVMQYIDYEKCSGDDELTKALKQLVNEGVIENEETKEIDRKRIIKLFNSELGMRLATAKNLNREFKFSILIPSEDYVKDATLSEKSNQKAGHAGDEIKAVSSEPYAGEKTGKNAGDKILLQGVIDCFFEENGEIVLIDFKTDKVTDSTIKQRVNEYTPQLNIYASALERITKKRVKERIIYFFAVDRACDIT
ncbi:MAG: UvrD-helicase domain-containing protein [Oscillospiraceae bacterium]|nr:UvrD-helicase domain-containing protein [Oscillospiraceae bacterium]